MNKKSIKLNRMAEQNLLDVFSCPLVSGFMLESELSKDFFNTTKEFFVLGYSVEPQLKRAILDMLSQFMSEIKSDHESGHFYECESLFTRNTISMVIIESMIVLFFKDSIAKVSGKNLKEQTEVLKEIMVAMFNDTIKTGQINNHDYQKYKNENLKSMQDARDIFEKERLNEIKDNRK
jgi:hypothetical protein